MSLPRSVSQIARILSDCMTQRVLVSEIQLSRQNELVLARLIFYGERGRTKADLFRCITSPMPGEYVFSGLEQEGIAFDEHGAPYAASSEDLGLAGGVSGSECVVALKCSRALDPDDLRRAVFERTPFGSLLYPKLGGVGSRGKVVLKVGLARYELSPRNGLPFSEWEFEGSMLAAVKTDAELKDVLFRQFHHNGEMSVSKVSVTKLAELLGVKNETAYGLQPKLAMKIDCIPTDGRAVRIERALAGQQLYGLKAAIGEAYVKSLDSSVRDLEKRKSEFELRHKVRGVLNGDLIDLGYEPTNEKDTIILSVRAERLLAVLFHGVFEILGHTAQIGIDAFARRKKNAYQPPAIVPVEFEYSLQSFFAHGHLLKQVELIICWTSDSVPDGVNAFGSGGLGTGDYQFDISSRGDLRVIDYDGHRIDVVSLNRLSSIEVLGAGRVL